MDRPVAQSILERLHAAQNDMYAGGDIRPVRALLTDDVEWHVPGANAIAGAYRGIDEVVSGMKGAFQLDDQVITFRSLSFSVPGAAVDLTGRYDMVADDMDFHGAAKLVAKVSQTQTGWKHWVLKPVDPFLSKNGAGTFLRIKVEGSSAAPSFGLDRGRKERKDRKGDASNGN